MSTDKLLDNIHKLDTGNYVSWKTEVTFALKLRGLWSAINGDPANQAEDWKASSYLGLTCARHQ